MINKIIIVQHLYSVTTAKTQRMLAAAKAYREKGLEVVFIVSSTKGHVVSDQGFRFLCFKETSYNKISCFYNLLKAIKREYTDNSVILLDGVPLYTFLLGKRSYNVFAEITEIPFFGLKPNMIMRVMEWIRFYGVKNISGIQVISPSLKDYYKEKGIENIVVINMFVDYSRFDKLENSTVEKIISYCGTISLYKDGVDDLIKSFYTFSQTYPDYRLQLIGNFENDTVKEKLNLLVRTYNLDDKVIFRGRVNADDMPQLLKQSEILVLARPANKQAQYGFPTKLGEYLATGNPVVVTSVGDIPLFLKHKENALLSEPNNPKEFAKKLMWIAENKESALMIGNRGKDLVYNEFSSNIQIEKSIRFMQEVLCDVKNN